MKRLIASVIASLLAFSAFAADVKISALPAGTTIAGTEAVPMVQSAATVRTTPSALLTYVNSTQTAANIIAHWSGSCSASSVLFGGGACGLIDLTANVSGILPAANGGTNNAFTQFTGPATSAKTFTLPNASSTILTSNALVSVAQGGTGVGTLTGPIKGNGTSAFSAAASADIIGLWSGTCSASTILLGDGSCGADPGQPAGANPTASLGLTAINGVATTFMRSDGAPALNVAINPTWSGTHIFSNAVTGASFIPSGSSVPTNGMYLASANTVNIASNSTSRLSVGSGGEIGVAIGVKVSNPTTPYVTFNTTGQSANARAWGIQGTGATLDFNAQDDAGGTLRDYMLVTRSGAAISSINFGNATDNPSYTFLGNTTASFNTAVNVFGSSLSISRADPREYFAETDQGSDLKTWLINPLSGVLTFSTVTDALATGKNYLTVTRGTTTAIASMAFGNATDNPTYSFLGTGNVNVAGAVSATGSSVGARFSIGSASGTAVGVGITQPTANALGFWTASTQRATFDSAGNFNVNSGIVSSGTKFTTSGCSVSASTGGATAGVFTLGANTCNVVITLGGATGSTAPNGWSCDAHDRTAPTILIGGESSSTTTTATIAIPVTAGATDVISFSCVGF